METGVKFVGTTSGNNIFSNSMFQEVIMHTVMKVRSAFLCIGLEIVMLFPYSENLADRWGYHSVAA